MWDIVRELVADGVTIFLTTQYLEEADQLADRIALLTRADWSPTARRPISSNSYLADMSACASPTSTNSVRLHTLAGSAPDDETLTLQVPGDAASRRCGRFSTDWTPRPSRSPTSRSTPDLDDVFFALTARSDSPTEVSR